MSCGRQDGDVTLHDKHTTCKWPKVCLIMINETSCFPSPGREPQVHLSKKYVEKVTMTRKPTNT